MDTAATVGVEHAPVVAPSWNDMAPGSDFLRELIGVPLPPECQHYLLFSYAGGARFGGEANDGTVTLASQLRSDIQDGAARVLGFPESHASILSSEKVSDVLNEALDAAAAR